MQPAPGGPVIASLAQFIDVATRIRDEWRPRPVELAWLPWFRGQAEASQQNQIPEQSSRHDPLAADQRISDHTLSRCAGNRGTARQG
jgi:hypothetical protein